MKEGKMDEKKLIRLISKKNEDGLVYFIKNYGGLLKSVISKTLYKYPNLVEEVLNDSLLSIWNNISYYDSNKSSFKNWCASVARYRAIDALRIEVKHESIDLDQAEDLAYDGDFDKLLVKDILASLSNEDQRLFIDLFVEGKSYEEVSKDLSTTKNALYSRVKRARHKLKKEFSK